MTIDIGVSSDSSIRLLVFQALKIYETSALFQFLEDRSSIVRTAAARELQTRGGHDVFEKGVELIHSKSANNREIATFLLGQLGTPSMPFRDDSIPLLESRLREDPSPAVRATAAAALGHLRAIRSLEVLTNAAYDEAAEVRAAVAGSLTRFLYDSRAVSCLKELQRDQDTTVRYWANIDGNDEIAESKNRPGAKSGTRV